MSSISDLVRKAQKGITEPLPKSTDILLVTVEAFHRRTNGVAAFRAEMEDILAQPIEIVGGGGKDGHLDVYLGLGKLTKEQQSGIEDFISNRENLDFFKSRYRLEALSFVPA